MRKLFWFLLLVTLGCTSTWAQSYEFKKDRPPRMAVGKLAWSPPFTGDSLIQTKEQARVLTTGMRSHLGTEMVKLGKFELIERQNLGAIMDELTRVYFTDFFEVDDAGPQYGKLKGIDFILLGNISQFSKLEKKTGMVGLGKKHSSLYMVLDLRLIEVETGKIWFADSVATEVSLGSSFRMTSLTRGVVGRGLMSKDRDTRAAAVAMADGDMTEFNNTFGEAQKIEELVRRTSRDVIKAVVPLMVPISVAQEGPQNLVLNYGENMLEEGDVLEVFTKDDKVLVDPVTGQKLGASLTYQGKVRVSRTQQRMSFAVAHEGLNLQNVKKGAVLKLVDKEEPEKKGGFFKRKKKR